MTKHAERQYMETFSSAVARKLRGELAERRITQADLARRTGMRQQALSRRLTGDVAIDVDELAAVCDAAGINMLELMLSAKRNPPRPDEPDEGGMYAVGGSNPGPTDLEPCRAVSFLSPRSRRVFAARAAA